MTQGFTPNPNDAEEMARQAAYFGKPGDITVPVQTVGAPAPPPVDTSYWGQPAAPPPTMDELAARSVAAMNAPAPGPPAAPPANVPSIASLRSGSIDMNAEAQGAPPKPATTPQEDRAALALAHYGGAPSPGAKPKATAVGGGSSGPSDLTKANRALRGTYDEEKGAVQRGANAEEDRSAGLATGAADIARQKMDDQAIAQVEAANAAKHFEDYSAETQRQIDAVRTKTIQPNRAYADTGSAVTAVIGGVLGGIYQGLNKLQSNPFLDQMNKTMDRDIAAQETDLATQKGSIAERKGLLAEMRATYKDEALAKIQAKNLYYEGAKEQLAAEAATYDSPAIQARADQAITALSREQAKLDINDAMRKAAAAQAAASAAEHRRQVDFDNQLKLQDIKNKTVTAEAGAAKDFAEGGKKEAGDAARFVSTGKDAQGNPTGYLDRNAEGAKEREDSRAAATALLKKIDRVQEIRSGQGTLGRTINRSDPKDTIQLYTPEWQTQLRTLNAEMTTDWAHAKKLGALSESDRGLAKDALGDLESRGDKADVQLNELRRTVQAALDAETEAAAGAKATKYIDPQTGREHVVVSGSTNAPTNQRTIPREKVGP